MDARTVAPALQWLMGHANGGGWPARVNGVPSLTVTSEVVLALIETRATLTPAWESVIEQIDRSVFEATDFIEAQLLTRAEDLDMPNLSYAIQALAATGRSVSDEVVGQTLRQFLALFRPDAQAWVLAESVEEVDSFASCLAGIAMNAILNVYPASRFAVTVSSADRKKLRRLLDQTDHYVFTLAERGERGGWLDAGSRDDTEQPSITAFALYYRHARLTAMGATPAAIEADPLCASAVEFLEGFPPLQGTSYSLARGSYSVFHAPYTLVSLSGLLDHLPPSQLTYFYSLAAALAGPELRAETTLGLGGWYPRTLAKAGQPSIWATAHALRGLAVVDMDARALRALDSYMDVGRGSNNPSDVVDDALDAKPPDPSFARLQEAHRLMPVPFVSVVRGPLQLGSATWLLAFCAGVLAVLAGAFAAAFSNHNHAAPVLMFGAFSSLGLAAYFTLQAASGVEDRDSWRARAKRLAQALSATAGIATFLFAVVAFLDYLGILDIS